MLKFSANLGFLWKELSLPEAIHRAAEAGFSAVECHWPYDDADADAVKQALDETRLPMLGLNTRKGGQAGDNGLSALPGREAEARSAIDEAYAYGARIGAKAVHVMAGRSAGLENAAQTFEANLRYACDLAAENGMGVLIEPLNHRDAPDYFLITVEMAAGIVERIGRPELKIMFDCYHLQITGGDLFTRFNAYRNAIGHVQFAGVPARGEPDEGEIAYERLLPMIAAAGYGGHFGAEYKPKGQTEETLGWLGGMSKKLG